MSVVRRSHSSRKSIIKHAAASTNFTPRQSASISSIDDLKIARALLSSRDSMSRTTISKTKTKTSASRFRSSSPIKTPPSPTANKHSHSHSTALVTSTEEKINISNKDPCDTEEVKVISSKETTEIDRCAICLDDYTEPKQLDKCGHTFCTDCIEHYFQAVKPQCPCCFTIYGEIRGNQPEDGTMTYTILKSRLPGFGRNSTGTIQITYNFPNGIQDEKHPNPNTPYYGTTREAYLPDNDDGRHVLALLQRGFDLGQIFTVGQSRTTGCDNVVTWNDVHHKTNTHGGMENFGYPDETYLNRVQQELAAKGIK